MNFEGDITQISDKQLSFIKSVIAKHDFGDAKVTVTAVGKPGDNYVANVKRIEIIKDGEVKMKMIAKVAPTTPELRMMANSALVFSNECFIYTEVFPKFSELENAADVPVEDRLRYPICYGCSMEPSNEVILLEDLNVSGFVMLDRFKPLSDNDVKLVLKNFAILHSLSFALKEKEPVTFDAFGKNLFNVWEFFSAALAGFFMQVENEILAAVDQEKHKTVLKGILAHTADSMIKLHKVDGTSRYAVVQHGDSWTNNFLFQLEDGVPKTCCMIDYQQSRVNSPVADLVYMLFACTDYDARAKHFQEWIDYYHVHLNHCLSNFGLEASYMYSRDQLDADLKRHGKASLGQAVILASMMVRESAQAAKLKEVLEQGFTPEELMKQMGTSSMSADTIMLFKSKIEGLVDSHLELGLI